MMKRLRVKLATGVFTLAASLLFLFPLPAGAVSLGEVRVMSSLGEPVSLEIDLFDVADIDLNRLQVSIASPDDFAAFNLAYMPLLDDLEITWEEQPGNAVTILVTGPEPMDEPFLEMLLHLRWPGGALMREYIMLFDPPGREPPVQFIVEEEPASRVPEAPAVETAPEPAAPVVRVEAGSTRATEPEAALRVVVETPAEATPSPVPGQTLAPAQREREADIEDRPDVRTQLAIDVGNINAANTTGNRRANNVSRAVYTVRQGDSLWNIALQYLPANGNISIYQMLLGIHNLNRGAFLNENISLLKIYEELLIPNRNDLSAIAAGSAESEFNARWESGIQRPAVDNPAAFTPISLAGETPVDEEDLAADTAPVDEPAGEESVAVPPQNGLSLAAASTPLQIPGNEAADDPADPPANSAATVPVIETQPGPQSLPANGPGAGQAPVEVSLDQVIQDISVLAEAADNPYLDRVVESAGQVQSLLQSRQERRQALEQQLRESREQLAAVRAMTASLVAAQASEPPADQPGDLEVYAMGAVSAGLFIALVFALVMILRVSTDLKSRRANAPGVDFSYDDIPAPSAPVKKNTARAEPAFGDGITTTVDVDSGSGPAAAGHVNLAGAVESSASAAGPMKQKREKAQDEESDFAEMMSVLDIQDSDEADDDGESPNTGKSAR